MIGTSHSPYRHFLLFLLLFVVQSPVYSQVWHSVRRHGPVEVPRALVLDSVDAAGLPFGSGVLLSSDHYEASGEGERVLPNGEGYLVHGEGVAEQASVAVYTISLDLSGYFNGQVCLMGRGRFALFHEGVAVGQGECTDSLSEAVPVVSYPLMSFVGRESFAVRSVRLPGDGPGQFRLVLLDSGATLSAHVRTPVIWADSAPRRSLALADMMTGKFIVDVETNSDGSYTLVRYYETVDSITQYYTQLRDGQGRVLRDDASLNGWSFAFDRPGTLYRVRTVGTDNQLVLLDLASGLEQVIYQHLPESNMMFTNDFKSGYFYKKAEGPAKDPRVIRHLSPDDRQAAWRNRSNIYRYDGATGVSMPITHGYHSVSIMDMNDDGSELLIGVYRTDYSRFPYNFVSVLLYDAQSGRVDTLCRDEEGFIHFSFIPWSKKEYLVGASANAFGGVGLRLEPGQVANGYERELYLFDRESGQVKPLTADFDPSVGAFDYSRKERVVYFRAEAGSRYPLYELDLRSGRIRPLPVREDDVNSFSVATRTGTIWYCGQSALNGDRLYQLNGRRQQLHWDLSAEKYAHVDLGSVHDWNYTTPEGTKIEGWYYLPPNFDASRRYPLLVYYYGGTSPITRGLEGKYSLAMFAAQGYVVYTLNPSGTTGYGQEFAARHLNAWGNPTADEIIAAVSAFADEHAFVNSDKIGCFGASYGGFMTQYLLTRTDLFAAAISHAGISSISNYWGSGYWGMGYSTVASYGSFPWNQPNLYVTQSPLFNADKIHTPLLLLHGGADTNVPFAESVNMFNALRVLGREVELIEFTGEDHFIQEFNRRVSWTYSMFAWFAKWLQDEPHLWDAMYPPVNL